MSASAHNYQWQRGIVLDINPTLGLITVSLLIGSTVDLPYVGSLPVVGDVVWCVEVVPGSLGVIGNPGQQRQPFLRANFQPQTLADSTETQIGTAGGSLADLIVFDPSCYNVTSGVFTVPWDGLYYFVAQVGYTANSTGARVAALTSNVTTNFLFASGAAVPSGVQTNLQVSGSAPLTTGEAVILEAYQASGGNLATLAGRGNTFLEVHYLGSMRGANATETV